MAGQGSVGKRCVPGLSGDSFDVGRRSHLNLDAIHLDSELATEATNSLCFVGANPFPSQSMIDMNYVHMQTSRDSENRQGGGVCSSRHRAYNACWRQRKTAAASHPT